MQGFIAGNDKGALTSFTFPLNLNGKSVEQVNVHNGTVTKIITSPDFRYLFSTSSDGSIFIFQILEQ